MEVLFYSKEGVEFTDALATVSNYKDGDIYLSASSEHLTTAKKEVDEKGNTRHYIRKCTTGANGGHFIDPFGSLSNARDFTSYDNKSARRFYEYTLVNPDVFHRYIRYLRSRNPAHLRNAERDYNNTPVERFAHAAR